MFVNFSTPWVKQYNLYSRSQINTKVGAGKRGVIYGDINSINNHPRYYLKNFNCGALSGFTTFGFSSGYRFTELFGVDGNISNIFETEQREFVGAPSVSRLFFIELRAHLTNKKSKIRMRIL